MPDLADSGSWGPAPERLHEAGLQVSAYGFFNPRIFHPSWFLAQGLLSEDAVTAVLEGGGDEMVTHRMVSRWSTGSVSMQVTLEELQFATQDQTQGVPLRELLASVLTALPHTPVTGLRVSRYVHLARGRAAGAVRGADPGGGTGEPVDTVEVGNGVKASLAAMVSDWTAALLPAPVVETLEISSATGEGNGNEVLARVGPSYTYPDAFFLSCDDVVSLAGGGGPGSAAGAAAGLAAVWDDAQERARRVFASLSERLIDG